MQLHKRKFLTRVAALCGSVALSGRVSGASSGARQQYRVINLGLGESLTGINARGQFAFTRYDPSDYRMQVVFFDGARLLDIGNLGGEVVRATGVNNLSQVTGIASTPTEAIRAFVWSRQQGMLDIGLLPGRVASWEPVINNRGVVTGYAEAELPPPYPHAFRWSSTSGIEDLGVLLEGEGAASYGRAINDAGVITGNSWAGGSDYHAFLWRPGFGMQDIDTLKSGYSEPIAISADGLVAGNRFHPGENQARVFWWTERTGMRDIPIGAAAAASMSSMSSSGRIAGILSFPDFPARAMTWTREQGLRELGTLGGGASYAFGANNQDQVVGSALAPGEEHFRAFIWNRREGMVDLNSRLVRAPRDLHLEVAWAIADNGAIVAASNAGLVLLQPYTAGRCVPTVGPVHGPALVPVGASVELGFDIASDQAGGTVAVEWQWGDGSNGQRVSERLSRGQAACRARHSYALPGIYMVKATVLDSSAEAVQVQRRVLVHGQGAGAVAASGALVLPASGGPGALRHAGGALAQFAFHTGAQQGQFVFITPAFVFSSRNLRALPRAGQQVELAGTGSLNGRAGYRFSVTGQAGSGGRIARLRVAIQDATNPQAAPVFTHDTGAAAAQLARNSVGAPAIEGSIVLY